MSVKGKVKRLNKKIKESYSQIACLEYTIDAEKVKYERERTTLRNLIKFFVTNQVDDLAEGGVQIDREYVDKLKDMDVNIWYDIDYNAYVIKLKEVGDG